MIEVAILYLEFSGYYSPSLLIRIDHIANAEKGSNFLLKLS
jgi:hypothetical protein